MKDINVGPRASLCVTHGHDTEGTPFLALTIGNSRPMALSVDSVLKLAEQLTRWIMSPCAQPIAPDSLNHHCVFDVNSPSLYGKPRAGGDA